MFDVRTSLEAIEGMLKRSAYFSGHTVLVGEPKQPPKGRLTAALWMTSAEVAAVMLNGSMVERHAVTLRIYRREDQSPAELQEVELEGAVGAVERALMGDFMLRETVIAVDPGGMRGGRLSAEFGYLEMGGAVFRVADMTVPLIVDDPVTFAA